MKKFNKKGFTLVELLVTIVLLGIVAAIIIYNMTGVTKNNTESDYQKFVASVRSAASVYADTNPDVFGDLYLNRAYIYVKVSDLIKNGLLDENTTNPYTGEKIDPEEIIKVNLDSTSGQLNYIYPLTEDDKQQEVFLVAISDYITWGEPYTTDDCMHGAGTYQLALSDEDGNLIHLTEENIKEYHVTCTLPTDMEVYSEELKKKGNYNAGTYKVTYNWLTKSGTKKSAQRELRVMPKVVPTFKTNHPEYRIGTDEWFEPKYNTSTGKWDKLEYYPYIEQASEKTVFSVTSKSNISGKVFNEYSGKGNEDLKAKYTKDVYDGPRSYTITATIWGRYHTDYNYSVSNTVKMQSKLVIPASFVSGGNDRWQTSTSFTIKDTHSPANIDYYEYKAIGATESADNKASVNTSYTFKKTKGLTNTTTTVYMSNLGLSNNRKEYPNIAIRAINTDGYAGDWVTFTKAKMTNELELLLADDCRQKGYSTGRCAFSTKEKYINYDTKRFVLMENVNDNSALAAYDSGVFANVTPMSIFTQTQSVFVHNATYTIQYQGTQADVKVITQKAQELTGALPNYLTILRMHRWPFGSAYVGNVDDNLYLNYQGVLKGTYEFWSTTKKYARIQALKCYLDDMSGETSAVNEVDCSTIMDEVEANADENEVVPKCEIDGVEVDCDNVAGTLNSSSLDYIDTYGKINKAANTDGKPIKPLIDLQSSRVVVTSGNGTYSSPYKIALANKNTWGARAND